MNIADGEPELRRTQEEISHLGAVLEGRVEDQEIGDVEEGVVFNDDDDGDNGGVMYANGYHGNGASYVVVADTAASMVLCLHRARSANGTLLAQQNLFDKHTKTGIRPWT